MNTTKENSHQEEPTTIETSLKHLEDVPVPPFAKQLIGSIGKLNERLSQNFIPPVLIALCMMSASLFNKMEEKNKKHTSYFPSKSNKLMTQLEVSHYALVTSLAGIWLILFSLEFNQVKRAQRKQIERLSKGIREEISYIEALFKSNSFSNSRSLQGHARLENIPDNRSFYAFRIIGGGLTAHWILNYLFLNPLEIPFLDPQDYWILLQAKKIPDLSYQSLFYYSAFISLCALGVCVSTYLAQTDNETIELDKLLKQYKSLRPPTLIRISQAAHTTNLRLLAILINNSIPAIIEISDQEQLNQRLLDKIISAVKDMLNPDTAVEVTVQLTTHISHFESSIDSYTTEKKMNMANAFFEGTEITVPLEASHRPQRANEAPLPHYRPS